MRYSPILHSIKQYLFVVDLESDVDNIQTAKGNKLQELLSLVVLAQCVAALQKKLGTKLSEVNL